MLNSIIGKMNKEDCYQTYQLLVEDCIEYEKISRKKMVEECINIYKNNPGIINYIFNMEELESLYSLPEIVSNKEYKMISKYANFFLYCINENCSNYTITLELKDIISAAKNIYFKHKKDIERDKEYQYIFVGIFRAYGALTPQEFFKMLQKLNIDKSNFEKKNYYFWRFVSFDDYNSIRCALVLRDLMGYSENLIESHPKEIFLSKNNESFKEIGCYYFDRKSPHYKNAIRHKKISDFFTNTDLIDFIILSGAGLAEPYYIDKYESFVSNLSDEERNDLFSLFDCMPKFIFNKNQNNILSEVDGELFYMLMMPFLKFAGNKYGIEFDYYNYKYNGDQANKILDKCIEDKFKLVDDYLRSNTIPEEDVNIIKGLKNFIAGPFVILKHLKDGSIFMDMQNNLYLVKGIKSSIDKMTGLSETPVMCETFLFQFKDSIIYSSIIKPYPVRIVGNMKKQFMDLYKNNKAKIIKKLY